VDAQAQKEALDVRKFTVVLMVWSMEAGTVGDERYTTDSGEPPRQNLMKFDQLGKLLLDSFHRDDLRSQALPRDYMMDPGVSSNTG
jgi:hypothetical protein